MGGVIRGAFSLPYFLLVVSKLSLMNNVFSIKPVETNLKGCGFVHVSHNTKHQLLSPGLCLTLRQIIIQKIHEIPTFH